MKADAYIETVQQTIRKAWDSQRDTISTIADWIVETSTSGKRVYIFGCSHAGILAEEAFYRTGGLAIINPIFFPAMMLNTRPITMTSDVERINGLGKVLAKENHLESGDLLILHSVSGRNNVPVEFALEAKALGVRTVAITNIAYSSSVTSRHPSGKRLFEVCDLILDNCGDVGDAAVDFENFPQKSGPTSTACGTALLNGIVVETVEKMLASGVKPPVFMSANLDGGDAYNQAIFREYKDQICYM